MLAGEYTFIRHEHNQGFSEKSKKDYDFASVTLSDGIESFDMDLEQKVIPSLAGLSKGDKVQILVEPGIRFKRTVFKVVEVSPVKVLQKS